MGSFAIFLILVLTLFSPTFGQQTRSRLNPTILQDSRDLPQVDGTFGFLYRTEDGIAHGAVGDSSGVIHGRYTYTDPTGLKVNFNYNAGSRRTPGYNYDQQEAPKRPTPQQQPQTYEQPRQQVYDRPAQQSRHQANYNEQPTREQYEEVEQPQPRPQPLPRPRPRPNQARYQTQNDVDYGSYSY